MAIAFVYPGQGSQFVGMGKNLYENFPCAQNVMQRVCDTLKQDLKTLMFEGPLEYLTLTENTQPALLCASLMAQAVLEQEFGKPIEKLASAVAGHSLGEYSALTAAGCFTINDAALLVKLRGVSMQKAVPVEIGAMAAIIGLDLQTIEGFLSQASTAENFVDIANDNSPGQVVISGHKDAVAKVIEIAKQAGAKRVLPLPVSAPFHCALMQSAADIMALALEKTKKHFIKVPVYANVTADLYTENTVDTLLAKQIVGRVRWVEEIQHMVQSGINTFIEVGAGKVLTGLIKRIAPDAKTYNFGAMEDLESLTPLMKEAA